MFYTSYETTPLLQSCSLHSFVPQKLKYHPFVIHHILTINKPDFYHAILTQISINLNLNLDNHEGILRTIVDVNSTN